MFRELTVDDRVGVCGDPAHPGAPVAVTNLGALLLDAVMPSTQEMLLAPSVSTV